MRDPIIIDELHAHTSRSLFDVLTLNRRKPMVRAKFTVSQVIRNFWGGKEQTAVTIKLTPQYDQSIEEDRRFAKATPSGEITLYVDNPPAVAALLEGQVFYVDFTPVPKVDS